MFFWGEGGGGGGEYGLVTIANISLHPSKCWKKINVGE